MKIAIVSPHYPPAFVGGVEMHSQRLARQLRADGHACVVAAAEHVNEGPVPAVASRSCDEDGVVVERLAMTRDRNDSYWLFGEHAPLADWFDTWFDRVEPDLVHVQSGYLLGAEALSRAARRSIPTVVILHDYWFVCPRITLQQPGGRVCEGPETPGKCAWCLAGDQRGVGKLVRPLFGSTLARRAPPPLLRALLPVTAADVEARQRLVADRLSTASAVLSPSRFLQDVVSRELGHSSIELLPLGVDPSPPSRHDRQSDRLAQPLRVGFIGQVGPHKGAHVLVEAMTRFDARAMTCTIHGDLTRDADYAARLARLAAGHPGIHFAGPYMAGSVNEVLADLDVVVVPSIWFENRPFAILEAQAAGHPVVTSRLGGMAELVEHGRNGLLFSPGEVDDLARQLSRLLDEPRLLAHLRAGVVPPPTVDDEYRALTDVYARCLRGGASSEPAPLRAAEG